MSMEPLVVQGVLHETIWGGRLLETVAGKNLPEGAIVGESWETALDSPVTNVPYAGKTLGMLSQEYGERLYGSRARAIFGDRFPLLAKFIDAHAWLSVQVHPDDRYAHEHENGKLGKTEAWRILAVAPGSEIIHGFEQDATRAEVLEAIQQVQLEGLTHKLLVQPGDIVLNDAGTLHATGAGIVLYEIQEYSDVTYRLYDYGRLGPNGKGRDLHIDKGLDVLDYHTLPHHTCTPVTISRTERLLVASHHFAMSETTLHHDDIQGFATDGSSCHIVTVIGGAFTLQSSSGSIFPLPLGQTVVIPAEPGGYQIRGSSTQARMLTSWVPSERDPRVLTWREAQAH